MDLMLLTFLVILLTFAIAVWLYGKNKRQV